MFNVRKTIVFFTMFLLGSNAFAQDKISLHDAINYAMNNSEVLKQAKLDIEKVGQQVNETRAGALPQVSLNSSATYNILPQQFILPAEFMGGEPGSFTTVKAGQTWNAMSQVQLSQQIFNQQLFTGLKAAKSSREYYELAARVSEENVIQQVAVAFYQVIITQEQMKVIDANLSRVEKLQATVKGQYENGLAKKIDLDRILVNKSNLETQKLQLENAVSQQENLLKYYMGMPVGKEIVLDYTAAEEFEMSEQTILTNENLSTQNLVTLQSLKKQEELLVLQQKAIRAEAFPTLSLGANYTYNTQSDKLNLYTNKALNYDISSVNLSLKVPIFDGFARRSRVRQSEADIQKLQENIKQTDNSLQMNYSNSKKQITNSLQAINTQKANKKLAEEVFYSTQNNYKNGLASLTDLLNSESELVTAQNSYNEAILNYKVAEIEYIKAKGEIKSLINP